MLKILCLLGLFVLPACGFDFHAYDYKSHNNARLYLLNENMRQNGYSFDVDTDRIYLGRTITLYDIEEPKEEAQKQQAIKLTQAAE